MIWHVMASTINCGCQSIRLMFRDLGYITLLDVSKVKFGFSILSRFCPLSIPSDSLQVSVNIYIYVHIYNNFENFEDLYFCLFSKVIKFSVNMLNLHDLNVKHEKKSTGLTYIFFAYIKNFSGYSKLNVSDVNKEKNVDCSRSFFFHFFIIWPK